MLLFLRVSLSIKICLTIFLRLPFITITPTHGTVRRGDKMKCALSFEPRKECEATAIPLTCTVAGARQYRMRISGKPHC